MLYVLVAKVVQDGAGPGGLGLGDGESIYDSSRSRQSVVGTSP
jgi:hypothetical protein